MKFDKKMLQNITVLFVTGGAFGLGWFWGDIFKDDSSMEKYMIEQSMTEEDKEKNMKKLEFIYNYVSTNHIYRDNIDKQLMWENAFKGMLRDIDGGLTAYYPPVKQTNVEQQVSGTYIGFGIVIDESKKGVVYIERVDENSKAYEQDIKSGDIILTINDTDVSKTDINEIASIMNKETKLNITIQRGEELIETTLEKEIIVPPDMAHYSSLKNDNHYIKIDSFNDKAYEDFKKILEDNIKDKKGNALIIDLRGNYGGTLQSYEQIMDLLVGKDELLYIKSSLNDDEKIYSKDEDKYSFNKYIVLVNSETASAAELMAISIKDILNGTIIGTKTYGKASVQSVVDLKDGSYLYITDKEYITRNNERINGIGIEPDIVIQDYVKQYDKAVELAISKN